MATAVSPAIRRLARPGALVTAVGLMSGTAFDGIDAAIVRSDGQRVVDRRRALSLPYPEPFRARLRGLFGRPPEASDRPLIDALTDRHAEVVERLADAAGDAIDIVGFHGQTVLHAPGRPGAPGRTLQVGDAARLARRLGLPVIADFRLADVAAGGEGAPFVPLYHAALAVDLQRPLAVLNLGGVGNLTWIGAAGGDADALALLACDTGPGNALIDDWVATRTGAAFDADGRLAATGRVDRRRLEAWLRHPFFARPAPKSLDRDAFRSLLADLGGDDGRPAATPADGAATLTAFTAAAVALALPLLPQPPKRWLVTGGGRHNRTLMRLLAADLGAPVAPVEAVGWRGDVLEAEAFAFLAIRSLKGLPLSLPTTTGVPAPQPGGRLVLPAAAD